MTALRRVPHHKQAVRRLAYQVCHCEYAWDVPGCNPDKRPIAHIVKNTPRRRTRPVQKMNRPSRRPHLILDNSIVFTSPEPRI